MPSRGTYNLLLVLTPLFFLCLTCSGGGGPTLPPEQPYDPTRPTINSFRAMRGSSEVSDGIVYSGEDILLKADAESNALPASCGLGEDGLVSGNLTFVFRSIPPSGVPAPGNISQSSPPSCEALWRVPILDQFDRGEGLLYTLKVDVTDECLGNSSTGSITLRAFSNRGAPKISSVEVTSRADSLSPVTEEINCNGCYEVERGDQCILKVTAESRTLDQVCRNRGVAEGEELEYSWQVTDQSVRLTHDPRPAYADELRFSVPGAAQAGSEFTVECTVVDACTGTSLSLPFRFKVVAAPEITRLSGTANGLPLRPDPGFPQYIVVPGDRVELSAAARLADPALCASKGTSPCLQWSWKKKENGNTVSAPAFDAFPYPNELSTLNFVVPAVSNGTRYDYTCTVTDRSNGLSASKTITLVVAVPPSAALDFVKVNSQEVSANPQTGRLEVRANDTVQIRVSAQAGSGSTFCSERGVSASPPLEYTWENPWNALVLNYDRTPSTAYCDLLFLVPQWAVPIKADLRCRVADLCNGLSVVLSLPFEVVE